MIHNKVKSEDILNSIKLTKIREYQGGIEFLQSSGIWKSLTCHYNAPFFAQFFIDSNFEKPGDYFLYGIGDGQLIEYLAKREIPGKIYILETNLEIIKYADETHSILKLLNSCEHILFCGSNDITDIQSFLKRLPGHLRFRYFYPSISAVPDDLEFVKNWLNNRIIDLNNNEKYTDIFNKNIKFNLNKNLPDVLKIFSNKFSGIPCLIAMSGPTLEETLSSTAIVHTKPFVISAGRNGKVFKNKHLKPDLWVDMDQSEKPEIWKRLKENDASIPLVILDSASYLIHDYFHGPIGIVRSKTNRSDQSTLTTGKSTVAAFALELALKLGFEPIILAGQDLCFINNLSHINKTMSETITKNTPKVLCNDGEKRYTSKEFIRHLESIKTVARRYDKVIYTLSNQGAKIDGVENISENNLIKLLESLDFDKAQFVEEFHSQLKNNTSNIPKSNH